MSKDEDRYDSLIIHYWTKAEERYGRDAAADWRLAKSQVRAESNFDPAAENARTGALGLLQLMAATDIEADGRRDAANPEEAIREGIAYLWKQWNIFKKETGLERWKYALGAYNAGAGNILKAQSLAQQLGLNPARWASIAQVLPQITGSRNSRETIDYVARIVDEFRGGVRV